jgi:hypothetical protein
MSDDFLRLIPADPKFIPSAGAQGAVLQLLRSWLPAAEDITSELREETQFVDPGANLERVECTFCGCNLFDWWQDAMDEASACGFATLEVVVPCCHTETTLNDLRYEWPAGFARFVAEVRNPGREEALTDEEIRQLEQILGCALRQVLAHY